MMTGDETVYKEKELAKKLTTSLSSKRQDEGKRSFVLHCFGSPFFSIGDKRYGSCSLLWMYDKSTSGKLVSRTNISPTNRYRLSA